MTWGWVDGLLVDEWINNLRMGGWITPPKSPETTSHISTFLKETLFFKSHLKQLGRPNLQFWNESDSDDDDGDDDEGDNACV